MWRIKFFLTIFILLLAASVGGLKAYLDHYVAHQVVQFTQQFAKQAKIHYQSVEVSLLGTISIKSLTIQNIELGELKIATASISPLYELYDEKRLPNILQISLKNLEISTPDIAPPSPWWLKLAKYDAYYVTPRELKNLGYAQLFGDVTLSLQKMTKQAEFILKINSQQIGNWQLQMQLEDVTTLKQLTTASTTLPLHSFSLNYMDNGFLPKIFNHLAQRTSTTAANLQQQLSQKVQSDLQRNSGALDASVINPLQQFIHTPRSLTVMLEPNPSISLNSLLLVKPENLLQRLNLKITANGRK
jgi:hypothetical protein